MVVAAGGGGQPCGVFPRGYGGGDGGAGVAPEHGCGAAVGCGGCAFLSMNVSRT